MNAAAVFATQHEVGEATDENAGLGTFGGSCFEASERQCETIPSIAKFLFDVERFLYFGCMRRGSLLCNDLYDQRQDDG